MVLQLRFKVFELNMSSLCKNFLEDGWKEERVENNETILSIYNPNKNLSISQQKCRLPIHEFKDHLLYQIEKYQVVIVKGETGSGKSTQICQYLIESGWTKGDNNETYMIGVSQPRRIAAITLAKRVSEEMNCLLGDQVGYSIRFDECFKSGITQIKYMTEGILINEMMNDPLLKSYSVIMVDEVHERSLYTDILLGLLKKIIRKRHELRIIVASATLEIELFREYFSENGISVGILCIKGRTFPVEIYYTQEAVPDYIKSSVETVIKIHENLPNGDVLVFLTGQEEVERAIEILRNYIANIKERQDLKKMFVLPLYSSLPSWEQSKVFGTFPRSVRKVVVATNVAETSITLSGIVYVVDCGFVKTKVYDSKTCTDLLMVIPISQSSAEQRAGRAGRTRSGKAFRIYPEEEFKKLKKFSEPEIQRSSLARMIIQLKALGISNLLKFSFISPPPPCNIIKGLELLFALGALDENGALTPLGLKIAEFPLDPMFAKTLLVSGEAGCNEEIATIIAMLQVQNIFCTPIGSRAIQARNAKHNFSVEEGDLLSYLNVYNAFIKAGKVRSWADRHYLNYNGLLRAVEVRSRLVSTLTRFRIKMKACQEVNVIRKCIVQGFFANAAYLHHSGNYRTVRGDHPLHIHPSSVLYTLPRPPHWVVFVEVLHTTQEFMRDITAIECLWLYELVPHYYEYGTDREIAEKKALT